LETSVGGCGGGRGGSSKRRRSRPTEGSQCKQEERILSTSEKEESEATKKRRGEIRGRGKKGVNVKKGGGRSEKEKRWGRRNYVPTRRGLPEHGNGRKKKKMG